MSIKQKSIISFCLSLIMLFLLSCGNSSVSSKDNIPGSSSFKHENLSKGDSSSSFHLKRFWFEKESGSKNRGISHNIEGLIYKVGTNQFVVYCPAQSNLEYNRSNQDVRRSISPDFLTYNPAATVEVDGVPQSSGLDEHDFRSDVVYSVTSEGVTETYIVRVLPTVEGNILKYSDGSKPYAINPKHSNGYSLSLTVGTDDVDNIKKFFPGDQSLKVAAVAFDTNNDGVCETMDFTGPVYEAEIDPSLYEQEDMGKIYEFKIEVFYQSPGSMLSYVYTKRIAVAEHLEDSGGNTICLPDHEGGCYFTTFDFCYDELGNRNILALTGKSVKKFDGTFSNDSWWQEIGTIDNPMDPAFIKVLKDNDSILMGAGAGGSTYNGGGAGECSYGYFNSISNFTDITEENYENFFTGKVPFHFSGDIWDYERSLNGTSHDWIILNYGESSFKNSCISLTPWDDWVGSASKDIVILPGTPSCGVWVGAAGDIFFASCKAFGVMGGTVYRVLENDVIAAYNEDSSIVAGTDPRAVPIYDSSLGDPRSDKYTQYSLLGDNMGNIFVTGGLFGMSADTLGGYFETRLGKCQGETEPILITAGEGFGYVSLATVSFDKKYMGFVSDTNSGYEVWIIPIRGEPSND